MDVVFWLILVAIIAIVAVVARVRGAAPASIGWRRGCRPKDPAMKLLLRGTDLVGLPVVTWRVTTSPRCATCCSTPQSGHVLGFTLNKRGRLAGRMKEVLTREQIHAVGPAAVMVRADITLSPPPGPIRHAVMPGGDVIADRVMTDSGVQVGTVTDVVIDTATGSVVGYEVLSG